ncbi:MAG: DNA translocase FtsK, partial [Clostridiales bacterium]|nr:DNA translocase FtsK [Clostridiales bacterium]
MANSKQTKRGPGRPPGSGKKNTGESKSRNSNSQASLREERIAEMQAEYDRDRRNVDIIWSITLLAVALFLFFTVVMDTTGAFGRTIHDICLGLFGVMAYALPFMVLIFAGLLFARKLQHIGARTLTFGFLIFVNMCILNSYRFIDASALRYGIPDMADFYTEGVNGEGGGVIGMELGSLLVKFFGRPGLLIIASAILIISIFLVANTPISRFFENLVKKRETRQLMEEMEIAEAAKVQAAVASTATVGADPHTGIVPDMDEIYEQSVRAADLQDTLVLRDREKTSFWKRILNGIAREDDPDELPPHIAEVSGDAQGIDKVIARESGSGRSAAASAGYAAKAAFDRAPSPAPAVDPAPARSDAGIGMAPEITKRPAPPKKINDDTIFDRIRNRMRDTSPQVNYDDDDGDYGYPGRRVSAQEDTDKKSSASESRGLAPDSEQPSRIRAGKQYGLGDPEEVIYSGHYGLDGHSGKKQSKGLAEAAASTGNAAGAGIAAIRSARGLGAETDAPVNKKSQAAAPARKTVPEASTPAENNKAKETAKPEEISADDAALVESFNAQADDTSYELPPVSLLKKSTGSRQMMSDFQLEEKANLLEKTLNDFGVDARVLTVTQGASVTRYEVQPATGVKVSSITRLADDIALNLRAKTIRIEAPIPGKAAVGIEVENDKPSPVLIRELIESEEFDESKSKISFVVGKDISGNNIIADLKDMPHLLIAGATGSGKSVCINTIITSFLYKARPSELKLIMIDPKVVELANYNGIPHMLTPVVTDARKASRALAIAVEEMDKRYELFAKEGVKDLESYNELMRANHEPQNCKPQVVIIIDELADLMMAAPNEVENSICRLAQKARAAGMHLIVATQRPSVDVVTGLIKANIPSRIAFSVASQFDSRTILDMAGAEKLLGKGDMLFS